MLIVHVHVRVKPEHLDAFVAETEENARASLQEPGILRFDLIREAGGDGDRFVLVEVYRSEDDPAKHKQTAHYAKWRDAVEPMMAEPRRSVKYGEVFPREQTAWATSGYTRS
ncbi:putative quinol monooxygenase [Sandaracinus amylolyticus]|uniref:putative quinol monooxygenase n=1 Tax=Sandaracinus amylolyticus TaxID=927083 RepID=UPI002E32E820|nr:putative quinol monooxygenase [Sandaracinus amylolyticus]